MRRFSALVIAGLCVAATVLRADSPGQGYVFGVTEDNDLFHIPSTDRHYTQGFHLSLQLPDEKSPAPLYPMTWFPDLGMREPIHKYGLRIGQDMYTPDDIKHPVPDPKDRPYAGWLFMGWMRDNRGLSFFDLPTVDHTEVDLGIIGPASLAGRAQLWFHTGVDSASPRGWRYQLRNEPGVLIVLDRKLLLWESGADHFINLQVLAHGGINLGNIETSGRLGTQLRLGHNIPNEFAKSIGTAWGWYLFGGIDGRVVGYNEFLDGNVLRNSANVDKENLVAELRAGIALRLWRTQVSYTYTRLSREFVSQRGGDDIYGSVNLTYWF